MKLVVPKGKYVLAVSGGVDSMALLDLLSQRPGIELVIAHFNHGIRTDSYQDEVLVQEAAQRYGLVCFVGRAKLGFKASEEVARRARYSFLEEVVRHQEAVKIITAHHQDDWIETVLLNLLRGSGRQGVSAILSNRKVIRPLINVPKAQLIKYAEQNKLKWSEDSSNHDQSYLRNRLRSSILPNLTGGDRQLLLQNLEKVANINIKLDNELATISHKHLNRQTFADLPNKVGQELIVYLLRQLGVKDYDQATINRLSMAIKTATPNTKHPIKLNSYLKVNQEFAVFVTP